MKYDEFGKFLSYFSEPTTTVKSWNGRSLDISFFIYNKIFMLEFFKLSLFLKMSFFLLG